MNSFESAPIDNFNFEARACAQSSKILIAASGVGPVDMRLSTKDAIAQLQPLHEKHVVVHELNLSATTSRSGMRPAAAAEREPVYDPRNVF